MQAGRVSEWELRKNFVRVFPDVYVAKGVRLDVRARALAAGHWAKGDGVLVGYSAAALHGTRWLDGFPAEISTTRSARKHPGLRIYRGGIPDDQVCEIAGFRCTTPARTAFDLGRRLDFDQAVEMIDALCSATRTTSETIAALLPKLAGTRGCARVRKLLPYIDGGAESLTETRTRLLLVRAGFPKPETQIRVVHDGMVVARLDMGWRRWQVGVEYDGAQHWTDRGQRAWDIDRRAILAAMGWTIVHVSAAQLTKRPDTIIARTASALRAHGAQLARAT